MSADLRNLLKGMPVLVMGAGHYPNKADIVDIMARYPGATIRTEVIHHPRTRFVVTIRENHHVR